MRTVIVIYFCVDLLSAHGYSNTNNDFKREKKKRVRFNIYKKGAQFTLSSLFARIFFSKYKHNYRLVNILFSMSSNRIFTYDRKKKQNP